jgi:hypothetical protein
MNVNISRLMGLELNTNGEFRPLRLRASMTVWPRSFSRLGAMLERDVPVVHDREQEVQGTEVIGVICTIVHGCTRM